MTNYDWQLDAPPEGPTCPTCGGGLEVDYEAGRVYCPECESQEAEPLYEGTAMSDKMRWRYGDTNPVVAAVDSSTVIEIGDLLWQDKDDAKPAHHVGMSNSMADVARAGFARLFLGVAMQRSPSGDTDPVRVATTGVFEFACPSGTFELGDLVGVCHNDFSAHPELLNQQVASVRESQYAIGRVCKRVPTAAPSVLVDIRSTVMTGGVQGSSRPR